MEEKEQAKPLTPVGHQARSDEDEALSMQLKHHLHRRRYIKCCGCVTAFLLIVFVVLLVLSFTVFQIHHPEIRMNSIKAQTLMTDTKTVLFMEVSLKNPNAASFKFNIATTTVYYGDVVVGEGRSPAGEAKAMRTVQVNFTADLILPRVSSEGLTISSKTRIGGKVKVLGVIKKSVAAKINCTMTYNTSSRTFQNERCWPQFPI